MKKIILTITFIFISLFSLQAKASTLEDLQDVFKKYDIKIENKDIVIIKEIYNFWTNYGENIWPGVKPEETPIGIVFPEKYNILIGHPNPPKDAIFLTDSFPLLNKKAYLYKDTSFMYGAATQPDFNGEPTVFFNTLGTFNNYIHEYAIKNKLKSMEDYKKPVLLHMGDIMHEFFHAYQYSEMKLYKSKDNKKSKPIRLTKVDYPYLDSETDLLIGLEGKILSDIIKADTKSDCSELWKDFLSVRLTRREKLDNDLVRLEKYMELSEGTAQYVGSHLSYANQKQIDSLKELKTIPEFKDIKVSGDLKSVAINSIDALAAPDKSRYMLYVYFTGLAQASALDTISPDWKKDFFRKYRSFDEVLFDKIKTTENKTDRLAIIKKRYDSTKIMTSINDALVKLEKENEKKFNEYNSQEGMRYFISFINAKPRDILCYAPVLFVEYNDYRIFEAGCSKIELINDDMDSLASVDFSAAVPVFFNRKTGEIYFILNKEQDSPLNITSDIKKESSNITLYEKNVLLNSKVFNFKGNKIEVDKDKNNVNIKIYN